jgi:hypothetical protein
MVGLPSAFAIVFAIAQIFSLAAWIRPDMLPVVSKTNTTSIFDLATATPFGFVVLSVAVGSILAGAASLALSGFWAIKTPPGKVSPRIESKKAIRFIVVSCC